MINLREQKILQLLIEYYIRDGQPVSSRTLADNSAVSLSPASIRNVLADLEEQGYLQSPHTSAGRIPTKRAYRVFVENLLSTPPVECDAFVAEVEESLNPSLNARELLQAASSLMSRLTQMVSLVTIPKQDNFLLTHIEFLPLKNRQLLVVLVFNNGEVQNRIIDTPKKYTRSELERAANYLLANFGGKDLYTIRTQLLAVLEEAQRELDHILCEAIFMTKCVLEEISKGPDYVMAGQYHLLSIMPASDFNYIEDLWCAFEQKQEILHLLNQCLSRDGIKIFIGEESGYEPFDDCSVITSTYSFAKGEVLGVLGVVGPTRMPYERVIPLVGLTAKHLSRALSQKQLETP